MHEFIEALRYYAPLVALIAFLLALLSVTNAIFGLRDRNRNWRATRSKKSFKKGVKEFLEDLGIVTKYANEPGLFLLYLAEQAIIPALSLIGVVALFMIAIFEVVAMLSEELGTHTIHYLIASVALIISWFLLYVPFKFLLKLSVLLSNYNHPEKVVLRAIKVFGEGVKKNYLSKAEAKSVLR